MTLPDFISVRDITFLGMLLFSVGVVGVVSRRNLIVVLMSLEIMLNSVNLLFVAYSRAFSDLTGQLAVLFVMAIAAAEAALGLALIIALFRKTRSVLTDATEELKDT